MKINASIEARVKSGNEGRGFYKVEIGKTRDVEVECTFEEILRQAQDDAKRIAELDRLRRMKRQSSNWEGSEIERRRNQRQML